MTGSKRKPADPQGATTWSGAVGYEVFAVLCVCVTPAILSFALEVWLGGVQKECALLCECPRLSLSR